MTPNTIVETTRIAIARVVLMISPPTAMPSRTDIRFIGAAKYSSRFPWSFSQYSCAAIIHTTLSQNAAIAPPRMTKPT